METILYAMETTAIMQVCEQKKNRRKRQHEIENQDNLVILD